VYANTATAGAHVASGVFDLGATLGQYLGSFTHRYLLSAYSEH